LRMVSERLDHPAIGDPPTRTTRRLNPGELGVERLKPGDASLNRRKLALGDPVDLRAGAVGFVGQRQQGADVVDLETQLSRVTNKSEPPRRRAVVEAPIACRAGRFLHQANLLVEPDRRNLHAGLG